jgi:hypothetical protein
MKSVRRLFVLSGPQSGSDSSSTSTYSLTR